MEVYGIVLSITAHIQQVPPDSLVLGNQETRKCFRHITIYCYRETKIFWRNDKIPCDYVTVVSTWCTAQLFPLTRELIADVVPRVLSVGLTGWSTVAPKILLQVPAFIFIKCVEEEGKLLNIWLSVLTSAENAWFTDYQWTNQAWIKVPLLEHSINFCWFYTCSVKDTWFKV